MSDTLMQIPLTINLVNAGLVAGTTTTISVTTAPVVAINGKFGTTTLSASNNQSITPTTDINTGAAFPAILPNTTAAVVFGVNAAGTLVAAQGTAIPTNAGVTTTVGTFINPPQFPALPDNFVALAYSIVRVAPSATAGFTVGTTNWAASGVSCTTFQNVCTLPARPQIA